jgi:hypothetical protein
MPRNRRRLVRTEKIVGDRIRSRCASEEPWSMRITSIAVRAKCSPRCVSKRLSQYEWPMAIVVDVITSWRGT